jgi:lysophospholipase L1-like esterase
MRYLQFALLGLLALGALLPSPKPVSGTATGYPDSMASLGDSITRATNPEPSLLGDQPQYSWSTGDNSAVESHYYRILQQNSLISGNNYNDAVSGARMIHLNGQAQTVVSQGVEYVTILMGANDVCTSSEATMTPVGTFRSQIQQAMDTLTLGLPDARIFVASIPDIYRLWFILKDNPSAVFIWNTFSICQSLLANPTSTAQADVERRDQVRQRNIDFNTQLAEVCALYTKCRFDNNVGFDAQFEPIHVSSLDYFHPSIAGQTLGAGVSWEATFDFLDNDDDGIPNESDPDDDNDGYWDDDELSKGSDPLDDTSTPEHCDGVDNDGDTEVDEEPTGADWDIDGDTTKDCLDADVDTDGDGVVNTLDEDDDGDGVSDLTERALTTDELGNCSTNPSHDAFASDFDHDTDNDPGDLLGLFFFSMNQSAGEPFYSKRSDFDGDGDDDPGDILGFFFFFMNTKCAVFTFTNNTGSAVDDITITFSAAIVQANSALDSDLEGWGTGSLSAGNTVLDLDRPDGQGDLANGGTLTVVVIGPSALTVSSCQWTLDGVGQGVC